MAYIKVQEYDSLELAYQHVESWKFKLYAREITDLKNSLWVGFLEPLFWYLDLTSDF